MKVLIIDHDQDSIREIENLRGKKQIDIFTKDTAAKALKSIKHDLFDAIVCNVVLPDGTIDDIIEGQQLYNQNAPIIVIADFKRASDAVNAVKKGAHSFIRKPFQGDEFFLKIEKAIEFKRLKLETQNLRGERPLIYNTHNFIYKSDEMKKVLDLVKKVATTDSTVMITGETGTGKELISGAIHYNSNRADKAFVKVNCAALPPQLLESELFGHEKGAFTGADRLRIGRFEQANGGSILFDEITELNLETQVKLLRAIQEKQVERLGSSRSINIDVRLISATNRNIALEVKEGRFREDLFYRLNVFPIHIPSLRERRSDIIPLAQFFLQKFARDFGKSIDDFEKNALQLLKHHSWPGNVRELQNCIERAVLMTDKRIISSQDITLKQLPQEGDDEFKFIKIPKEGLNLDELEEDLIRQALRATNYVQKEAAELLRLTPRTLNYKIGKYGIVNPNWPKNNPG
jgi:DNA-binding NtrC family response regulator